VWYKRIGAVLAVLGGVAGFAELGTRWWMTGVWPLTNLYGSLSLFAAMGVLIFCAFAFKYDLWFAGSGVLAIAAIALAYGTNWNEGYMPAVPALQSYWIKIHVPRSRSRRSTSSSTPSSSASDRGPYVLAPPAWVSTSRSRSPRPVLSRARN
jgi:hypothetical protein